MEKIDRSVDSDDLEKRNQTNLPKLELDAKQAQGFISFFCQLPDYEQAVRFFDGKDHYTANGDNTTFIAITFYRRSQCSGI